MADRRIRVWSNWDTALTYDSLDEQSDRRAIFVGRDTLIAPLVAEIGEPSKRGTYLISGYRGTGKTTLLIEALSRAQEELDFRKHRLFPLVLNVSEVAASLGTVSSESPVLSIDPRRLLIALLRTIDHRLVGEAARTPSLAPVAEKARYAYEKATASKFARSESQAQDSVRTRSRELGLSLDSKNALTTLGAASGVAALALEAVWLVGPVAGLIHAAAAGLAALCAFAFTASIRRGSSEKATVTSQSAFEHDNSLQQLETDLRDLLELLKQHQMRTVVVMEELDKLDDPEGLQLAAVIRYFKNLFTQSPALFFFVTDKSYFDIIASAIKRARRARSYAVEHTFFTHRVFIGRPTIEESLEFISRIASNVDDSKAIDAVSETLGKPGRIEEADQLGKLVRVVLFKAANHLFDLKNELRRFARTVTRSSVGETHFLINDQTFPPEEAALAVFQDLIVEKTRSFEIKGGRTYANEVLADSLYAVFNELGSNRPQEIESFMPITGATSEEGLLLEEQLDLGEAARIRAAVLSLVGDLERGRAFLSRDPDANTFTWRSDAAHAFRYVRQLEKHEEGLIAELQRHAQLISTLPSSDQTHKLWGEGLEKRVTALRESPEPLNADTAAAELRTLQDEYAARLATEFAALTNDLNPVGFAFEPVAQGLGGSLYLVVPRGGDPRLGTSSPRGGVLLALGEYETLLDDLWSFIQPQAVPTLGALDRVGLVHVIHTAGNLELEVLSRGDRWRSDLSQPRDGRAAPLCAVDVVALGAPPLMNLSMLQRVAGSLAGYGAWARPETRPYEPIPNTTPDLTSQLAAWKAPGGAPLFHIDNPPSPAARFFAERDELEKEGRVVVRPPGSGAGMIMSTVATHCMLQGFGQAFGGPEFWEPVGRWLIASNRVILYFDWAMLFGWTPQNVVEILEAGGRVIVSKPGQGPDEIAGFNRETPKGVPLAT